MAPIRAFWPGLARVTLDLCRLRGSPAAIPHAPGLLALLLVAGTALDLIVGDELGDGSHALARSLLSNGVVLGLCWIALALRGFGHRYLQTVSALLACSVAFSLLQIPLAMVTGPPPVSAADLTSLQMVLGWTTLAVFMWQICVYAHIMRHALESTVGLAFALVVSWVVAFWALDSLLIGPLP